VLDVTLPPFNDGSSNVSQLHTLENYGIFIENFLVKNAQNMNLSYFTPIINEPLQIVKFFNVRYCEYIS
jgi:hypothetical protein